MQDGITMLMQPLQGVRLLSEGDPEEGAIIGFRKGGDEALFVSGDPEPPKGMEWIPVGAFSPNPESVIPIEEEGQPLEDPAVPEDQAPTEVPSKKGPFGRNRRRPELEE